MVNKYWINAECDGLEIGAMVFSFVLVLLYHVLLIGGSSLLPKRFALGKNLYYRSLWAERYLVTAERPPIDAIQTFRNSLMTSSFLATTAITIGFQGVGFAVGTSYELSEFSRIKLLVVASAFFLGFFFLTLNIRYVSHISYLVSVARPAEGWPEKGVAHKLRSLRQRRSHRKPAQHDDEHDHEDSHDEHSEEEAPTPAAPPAAPTKEELRQSHLVRSVKKMLKGSTIFFTLGLRCFYFAAPLAFWVAGPVWFMATTAIMVGVSFLLDFVI
ncbi:uncharacterized protein ACA1_388760 [Acanthamoeba castellanii str. Neff]|uniref:Uncharacterized protein n=1 Tax=Acanthamoeba castellanii (strain ATCC 30010 / Neff) TaxID=1257118 RepID=L8GDH4_ACACF|nr:uncharacterized protein ACA1_388760 [Acanthamoeba castellanii str. Neff]ELR11185.1 hypothetical protein ACA1_388760 [Acanthamoeba castellanii str. Neff]